METYKSLVCPGLSHFLACLSFLLLRSQLGSGARRANTASREFCSRLSYSACTSAQGSAVSLALGAVAMTTGETHLTPRANSFTLFVNGQLERVPWAQSHRGCRYPVCAVRHKAPGHPAPKGPADQLPLSPPPYICGQPCLSGTRVGRRRVCGDVRRFHMGTACRLQGSWAPGAGVQHQRLL